MAVYLIHFDEPYRHARHYVGWADGPANLSRRLRHHQAGNGSRLMAVVSAAGIGWRLARVWPDGDRKLERRIKAKAATRCCPLCVGDSAAGRRYPEETGGQ